MLITYKHVIIYFLCGDYFLAKNVKKYVHTKNITSALRFPTAKRYNVQQELTCAILYLT